MRYYIVILLLSTMLFLNSCENSFSETNEQNQTLSETSCFETHEQLQTSAETSCSETHEQLQTSAETEPTTVSDGYTYDFTLQMKQEVYDEEFTDVFGIAGATQPGGVLKICDDWAIYRVTETGEIFVGVESREQNWECEPLNEQDYTTFEFRIGRYSTIKEEGQDFVPGTYRIRPFQSYLPIEDLENVYVDFEVKASE